MCQKIYGYCKRCFGEITDYNYGSKNYCEDCEEIRKQETRIKNKRIRAKGSLP